MYPDKIDYEELLERAESSFRDVYLTLISIIQGVAFGFLGERAFDDPPPTTFQWVGYGTCLIVLIIVWQEYMVGSTMFTWIPTLLDSLVPFAVGVVEFVLIASVRRSIDAFLTCFAIFLGIAVVGYGNWLYHAARGGLLNRTSWPTLKRYVQFGTAYSATASPIAIGLVATSQIDVDIPAGMYYWLALGLVSPLFLHSIVNWSVPLHALRRQRAGRRSASARNE